MPIRGETPGLARVRRKGWIKLYWRAGKISRDAAEYPDQSIALPKDASPDEIAELCKHYTKRLEDWLAGAVKPRFLYNGTFKSLCEIFENDPDSPIRDVKRNTAEAYGDSLRIIKKTVGTRVVRVTSPMDCKRWYRRWREPKKPGAAERITRAHNALNMVRMILRFGRALGLEECGKLADGLAMLRFERAGAREGQMTLEQARAFIAEAVDRWPRRGEADGLRGLFMAIGVAAQFETMVRQKDVIGEWVADVEAEAGEKWIGSFTWEAIAGGGIWRLKTSKKGKTITHDLTKLDMLWPLLQQIPQADRAGAIVKGVGDRPIRDGRYRHWFREIARAAKIPDSVWNMDLRPGGVTEALEAGADETAVQRVATHAKPIMTRRYDRANAKAVESVAEARKKARKEA